MGKSSSSSCLKIIVCGSDAAENDGVHSSEAKAPSDKWGWSFRKRSSRHRVLGNNASSETTTFKDKETSQGGSIDFQSPVKPFNVDEKPHLTRPVEENSKTIVAPQNDNELKTSVVVIPAENGATVEDSNVSQDEVPFQSASTKTLAENKMADDVISENDSKEKSTEYKLADAVVVSENDSNDTSDQSSIAGESVVSKDESIKSADPKLSELGMASENGYDAVIMDEPVAIIIQTAMRGFLAQRKLVELKSAVKLQAFIRGHLVRRNAVETLLCIRAIIKVQALVRARSSKSLGQKYKPNAAQVSTLKLLQNSFARQLLETTSKPKSLKIRCDPRRPNSAWSWLERWMDFSASEAAEKLEPTVEPKNESEVEKIMEPSVEPDNENEFQKIEELSLEPEFKIEVQKIAMQSDDEYSAVAFSDSRDLKFNVNEGETLEDEENHISDDVTADNSFSACSLSTEFMTEQSHFQRQETIYEDAASADFEDVTTKVSLTHAEPVSLEDIPAMPAAEIQQPKVSMKRLAPSELNDEGKKFVYGSRKASNPAFIAAHSKFEELTSAANSGELTVFSHQDVVAEPHVNSAPSLDESVNKINKLGDVDVSGTFDPRVNIARSECGTEISVSSTLDSPDRSDIENAEAQRELQFLEKTSCAPVDGEKQDCEARSMSSNCVNDIPSVMIEQGEVHGTNDVSIEPAAAEVIPQMEQILETKALDLQTNFATINSVTNMESSLMEQKHQENGYNVSIEQGPATDHQAYKTSPDASSNSLMTVPESQGTPSSQVSVKAKRGKVDKHGLNKKRSSPSAEKRSPSNANVDLSDARISSEHLPKDHRSGKRRNSFGSTKSDTTDQEPRDSSSRISLPSYMQATESAKAKASSPKSSPDILDKEVHSKKRHSLPGASGRQGSPHIHRSSAQTAKSNGSHPSNERKWLR